MSYRLHQFSVILVIFLILYCLSQFDIGFLLVIVNPQPSWNVLKFQQLHFGGEQYKLSDFDSKLIRKYWELKAWLHQLQGQGNETAKPMPVPPDFFQFPTCYNLWDPSTFNDHGSEEDRLIAQDVWRKQSLIKNYVNNTTFNTQPKKIYIGNLTQWPDWTLGSEMRGSKRVSRCYDDGLTRKVANLEPTCDLVVEEPENWSSIDVLVTFQKMSLNFNRSFPSPNLTKLTFTLESPYLIPDKLMSDYHRIVSYWRRSLIVRKYNKWIYYDPNLQSREQDRDYSEGKTKMAAILVSNCKQVSNDRLRYVKELQNYINVDVFGKCGNLSCGKDKKSDCSDMLRKNYRFYLSFENSNCRDYITEKLYQNALKNELVPIVMGAHPDDYKLFAPQNSYIHIEDFESPRELASYLMFLAENPSYYNKYFEWKGTGEFSDYSNTEFFCRLCSMLHYTEKLKPMLSELNKFDWLPNANINDKGDKMCLKKGNWYWNRSSITDELVHQIINQGHNNQIEMVQVKV